jgi:hypothetical protein
VSIWYLYVAGIIAATLLIARLLVPLIVWSVEEKKRKRRSRRRKGYWPIYDEEWRP